MELLWYAILSVMLAVYVVLDGFDFGAGIAHLTVAKSEEERRTVLRAIGPLWDGNEVWLLAASGVLLLAFPKAFSAGLSGFYMHLMIVLWLLILRGISIEFRSHFENVLWRQFWDVAFAFSSTLMAIVLGAALGNVIRGVPLDETGYFSIPLFTNFRAGIHPGALDWYTVLVGLFTLAVLAGHGSLFLVWKTDGPLQERSRIFAFRSWVAVLVLGAAATLATAWLRPELYSALMSRPWTLVLVLLMLSGLAGVFLTLRRGRELSPFVSSSLFIAALLAATAAGMYPNLLFSTLDPSFNLHSRNAATGSYGLRIGLLWLSFGLLLVIGYFITLFRSFRGKVVAGQDETHD